MDIPNVKITINGTSDGRMSLNVKSEDKVKVGDVLQMLSVAIATTVANTIPKDLPEEERNLYIDKAAEIISEGVKNDFFTIMSHKNAAGIVLFGKEADFMGGVLGL